MQTRTLGDQAVQIARKARLQEPHIAALTDFSDAIAHDMRWWTPYFDPDSGGRGAKVLLLLESPGPAVSKTGFVSQDNPDPTADNMTHLLNDAGLVRSETLLWNIVPWQMSAERVVTPSRVQLEQAAPYTVGLLNLLPELMTVVLVGAKAQRGWKYVELPRERHVSVCTCPHPSPQNFNTRPAQREAAVAQLLRVAEQIKL